MLRQWFSDHYDGGVILDIGVGRAEVAAQLKQELPGIKIKGVEVWQPYLEGLNLAYLYAEGVWIGDIREFDWDSVEPEWVLWIDGPEHLEMNEAGNVLKIAVERASGGVICGSPLGEYPQGAYEGNEAETHRSVWSPEVFDALGGQEMWRSDVTGLFLLTKARWPSG